MQWRIGAAKITRIVELEGAGGTKFILPQASPEAVKEIGWLVPDYATADGKLKMSVHALVVEADGKRIVVDTCIGNNKKNRIVPVWNDLDTPFLFKLNEAGFAPETIDLVICTHLHVDHVGWNTKLAGNDWVPTFPNARYLFGRTEYEYWKDFEDNPEQRAVFADSVRPIVDAGLADIIPGTVQVSESISTVPTPGHSPGHMSIRIRSEGEEALLLGDVAHHPCQMAHPEWSSTFDSDPMQSARTRRDVFGEIADTGTVVIGGHFPAGRIVREGGAFRLVLREV
ncbi:MAG: MBL fold metallo-hydrolase [Xanthobacteraceae bacterium]|nr:MBL fold metallo-hydrolase [Xanthobacteraceae bacterium]QYK46113.1 MAG: MBL fold metallo-hydrolase [Xanthobacteraceae bacterium]